MQTYEAVLRDVSSQAVTDAAKRFMNGDVPGQSKTFAPSVAEFVQEARNLEEYIALRNRPRIPGHVYRPGPLKPFEVRAEKARAENADRPVLFEDIGFDQFRKMCSDKNLPMGSKWVACLGTIYGPVR